MKYFVYLNNKDNDSIVKQSFLISKNLHSMNNSRNYSNFINMFEQYNLTSLETESLENDKIRRYTTEIREKYLSFWQHSLENSKKLEFNNTFKGNLHSKKISPKMLFKSPKVDFSHRKMFSRFRFFFLASQERLSRRVRTSRDRQFDRRARLSGVMT